MGDLSAHFSRQELACPCGGRLQLEDKLLAALEKLRSLAKRPVLVHDGYRCPKHNREVGGVPGSEHTRGCAADIALPETSLQHMYELALEVPEFRGGGIGVYEGAGPWTSVPVGRAGLTVRGRYGEIQHLVQEPGVPAETSTATHAG